MRKTIVALFFVSCFVAIISSQVAAKYPMHKKVDKKVYITPPKLNNNPSWDVIATNREPLLSFFNAKGGSGKIVYSMQLDKVNTFNSPALLKYENIPEENKFLSSKLIDKKDALDDKSRYYWRVRAVDEEGNTSDWASTRFYVDTESDDSFMNLKRVSVKEVAVSSGFNVKNVYDLDDPGQNSFWQSTPPGSSSQWVMLDLGEEKEIARIWMLSNTVSPDGWLKDFVWQVSYDGKAWKDIADTAILQNDTFRNILDIAPVKGRYFRLFIKDWYGYAAQINATILYENGVPELPEVPEGDYVLLIGDQMNGFTFTELKDFVESQDLGLKAIVVPHYEASLKMVRNLPNKPVGIICSGNNAGYQNLPMFEYNGVYEIIRDSDIPLLGICCGHQLTAMAYGYTFARAMGWEDITSLENYHDRTKINIVKQDPIFEGIPNPYTAPEIHGWAVAHLPEDYELLAYSTYVQALKSNKKMLYGEQFHAEIKRPYNEGTPYLVNFLKMALKRKSLR